MNARITQTRPRLVVVGNGMAGMRTVEELLKLAPDVYEITVFGSEPHPNYNRILLSPVLAGEQTLDQIVLNAREWYADNGITLHAGRTITRIDRARRTVETADGLVATYDRLLLATGSTPFMLPVPGADQPGVITYRDIADTEAMIAASREHRHAVVIGGGLLGLEAASSCAAWTSRSCTSCPGSWSANSTARRRRCCSRRWKRRGSRSGSKRRRRR
jgi:nitrite reductase (NADH) large subunit